MTEGRRRLLSVLQILRGKEVALRAHVHKSNVSRWASGAWQPSRRARIMLELHCRIPIELWDVNAPPKYRIR